MEIAPSTASRLLTGKAALTPEMAIKLSVVIGSSPQMWLNLQNARVWQRQKNSGCVAITPSGYAIKMALYKAPFRTDDKRNIA